MTKIKVSSLQPGPQMDALVARARGWIRVRTINGNVWYTNNGGSISVDRYNPSGNGGQAFDLMEAYPMVYGYNEETGGHRAQCLYGHVVELGDSETIAVAVCKAVIAAHFGDEVTIDE